MKKPITTPSFKIEGKEHLALQVLEEVSVILQSAGADVEYVEKYFNEATSGDYDHLIGVTAEYVNII